MEMQEEKESLPAWMRYLPRTGWTSSSQEANKMGNVASKEAVKSSCKFSTTEVTMTRSRAKKGGRDVIHKSRGGHIEKKTSLNDKDQTAKSISSKHCAKR